MSDSDLTLPQNSENLIDELPKSLAECELTEKVICIFFLFFLSRPNDRRPLSTHQITLRKRFVKDLSSNFAPFPRACPTSVKRCEPNIPTSLTKRKTR